MKKIFQYIFSISFILILQGCFYQSVSSFDIEEADAICKNKGLKVMQIDSHFNGGEKVICSNNLGTWLYSK